MAYTPRTDFDGNATYMTNGYRSVGRTHLSALDSVENSFHTPTKDNDVIRGFGPRKRVSDGSKVGTPRANMTSKSSRSALRNLPATMGKGEFTPLMKSATKNNFLKNMSTRGGDGPKTPGYRENSRGGATPGLTQNMSDIYEEDGTTEHQTPQPQVMSSSAPSSPLPGGLMGRNGGGMLGDGNPTLKEQEKIIDRLDKDNWNLKLKCHFFEEQLSKAGPEINSLAMKENTELKVTKVTLQREVARYKKGVILAERELEDYRQQLADMRERSRRKQTDEEVQREMDLMQSEIDTRDNELRDLREELRQAKNDKSQELEKLRDEVEDLEAELRAKDRAIDVRDEELEELRQQSSRKESDEDMQREIDSLREDLDSKEIEVNELRDEVRLVANGRSHELEKLRDDIQDLEATIREKERAIDERDEQLEKLKANEKYQQDLKSDAGMLSRDLDSARRERDLAQQEQERISSRLNVALDDLQRQADEKELLQNRHQALTDESGGLQVELARAQSRIEELQLHMKSNSGQLGEELEKVRRERDLLQRDKEFHQKEHDKISLRLTSALEDLNRQASENKRLQDQEHTLNDKLRDLQNEFARAESRINRLQQDFKSNSGKLGGDLDSARRERDAAQQEHDNVSSRLQAALDDLKHQEIEKELLQDRQQVLTDEVGDLQSELAGAKSRIEDLQQSLADEQEYGKGQQQKRSSDNIGQLQKVVAERNTIREELAQAHVELHDLRRSATEVEIERDELQAQLELEVLQQQQRPENELSLGHRDLSALRQSLEEARKREKNFLLRENEQKAGIRTLKSQIVELEKDLHEAHITKFNSNSVHNSPYEKTYEEIRNLRKQLSDTHRSLKEVRSKNRDLERAALREEDQKDLHELLKSSTLEAESLALKVSERDTRLNELKVQVRRIREERAYCVRKVETANKELEVLQQRYDEAIQQVSLGKSTTRHEKEMRGLGKEIIWLRARLQREQKFRRDLAWSKGLMELGERVRIACNSADLRMINEMGVDAQDRTSTGSPRHKFRSAISLVMATVRMKRMCQDWQRTRKIGEGLKRAKSEMLKRREASNKSLLGL
ncbi:hypothetical protein N7495_008518 [Penicillium taxi]|uniref:uncharacterized protein n=1 Tax=Penicillium taxi TaxID=168475 RepID=UPI0025458281|nr:uncharacterized protein N7495_008518 [Penicillium taxi]KAJ5888477.1 hypothetical protein N7495_008518 [Penicillium taxi]